MKQYNFNHIQGILCIHVSLVNGRCITPSVGCPLTATQTIVVTYFTRFSVWKKQILHHISIKTTICVITKKNCF